MTLETYSDLPIASPLKNVSGVFGALVLEQDTSYSLLHIRGIDAETLLQEPDMKIGDGIGASDDEMLARLRRDEFVLLARDGRRSQDHLKGFIGDRHVTVTDITHGRCVLNLYGIDVARVLRKVCGLDFSDTAFPVNHAAQTSLAKVRTLIIRYDYGVRQFYRLIVDRSLAQYVWDVVADAMQEFAN